jgi:hypothetical protein
LENTQPAQSYPTLREGHVLRLPPVYAEYFLISINY